MKNTIKITSALFIILMLFTSLASCNKKIDTEKLWENAKYTSDSEIGEGANTIILTVEAGEKRVVLKIKTDKATLGEALFEYGLVNDPSFFDVCNGIKADWNKDKAYWAFYIGGELAMHGIGDEKALTSGEPEYKLLYTK